MTCLLDTNVISDDVKPQPDSAVCDGQFVSWDAMAAVEWGRQQHSAAGKRQPQSLWDSLSEAVALSRGLVIATRNTADFPVARTINPWLAPARG